MSSFAGWPTALEAMPRLAGLRPRAGCAPNALGRALARHAVRAVAKIGVRKMSFPKCRAQEKAAWRFFLDVLFVRVVRRKQLVAWHAVYKCVGNHTT